MPKPHPRPWRRDSLFGPGPRVPLDRERRARFRALLDLNRRPGRLTPAAREVGRVLLRLLGDDGRCDPSIDTLARLSGFGRSAVIEGLARLRACGFVAWTRRLVRTAATGWQARQASNAYALAVPGAVAPRPAHESGSRPAVLRHLNPKRENLATEDAGARRSAAQQLLALGFPVPEAWH